MDGRVLFAVLPTFPGYNGVSTLPPNRLSGLGVEPFATSIKSCHAAQPHAPCSARILKLQRAGISTASAELLLVRMLDKIDRLCAERDRLKAQLPKPKSRVLAAFAGAYALDNDLFRHL
jgi:hypothetical protein